MYRAYGLLQPGSDFTLNAAADRLAARFPGFSVTRASEQILVATAGWEISLWLNADPSVRDESVGFAERIAGVEDGLDMESCDRRLEVWSDTPDPFIEHLADFHAVVEVLKSFAGVVVVDPNEPALL